MKRGASVPPNRRRCRPFPPYARHNGAPGRPGAAAVGGRAAGSEETGRRPDPVTRRAGAMGIASDGATESDASRSLSAR